MDLRQSWEITSKHLQRASSLLPDQSPKGIAEFKEFLEHNELECAMRVLEDEGFEAGTSKFWLALADAAENMQLPKDAAEFRKLADQ